MSPPKGLFITLGRLLEVMDCAQAHAAVFHSESFIIDKFTRIEIDGIERDLDRPDEVGLSSASTHLIPSSTIPCASSQIPRLLSRY